MKLHSFNCTSLLGSWLSIVSGSFGSKFRPGHQQFYFKIIHVCAFITKNHTRNQQMLKLYFSHNLS